MLEGDFDVGAGGGGDGSLLLLLLLLVLLFVLEDAVVDGSLDGVTGATLELLFRPRGVSLLLRFDMVARRGELVDGDGGGAYSLSAKHK